MLKNNNLNIFFQSNEFETILLKVANDDVVSFKNNNNWLVNHPVNTIIFANTLDTWSKVKDVYKSSFNELVYGKLPPEADIQETLLLVASRLKLIKWDIKL